MAHRKTTADRTLISVMQTSTLWVALVYAGHFWSIKAA